MSVNMMAASLRCSILSLIACCAASAPRRSYPNSFLPFSEFARRHNLFRQRFETRIAEQRVNSDISYVRTGAILITLFKPAECLLFVAQSKINKGKAVG